MRKRWPNHPILSLLFNHLVGYPTPLNINYLWGFGSISGLVLAIQLLSGIFLAIHYTPHADFAFLSVEHIMRDVYNGWIIRYLHANGASMFFIIVYLHICRGLYYGSYTEPRGHLWCSGVTILILMIATGFIGYVLPWGQMSIWGATVITNLISVIPFVGESIVKWIWGGFGVGHPTLNRFFSLHYVLPFAILGIVLLHLALLHVDGSNNPLGIDRRGERLTFYPYFYIKDLFGFFIILTILRLLVFFAPNYLGHPDNYIPANVIVTPDHIVPEWYFLPFYAILRSIPHKLGGVVAMGIALVGLIALPYINQAEVRSRSFRPIYRYFYWLFLFNAVILGWIGQKAIEYPFVDIGQLGTVFYFSFLFIGMPLIGLLERYFIRY